MKRNILNWGALTLMLCSTAACSSDIEPADLEPKNRTITFNVVNKEKESMTRATVADAFNNLYYYRYVGSSLVQSFTQTSTDDGFGSFADNMDYATYDIYVVGTKNTVTDFTNGVATFDKVSDTFSCYLNLTVDKQTAASQTLDLFRRVAKFELVASDALPENLATVDVTMTGGATTLDVKTGKGSATATQTKTITVPASNIGKTGCTFIAYTFLMEDESTVEVSITAKDSEGGTIVEYTFDDVAMQTNYITRYTGKLFGDDFTSNVNVSTEWAGEKDFEF